MSPYQVIFLDFYGTVTSGDVDAVERACARIVEDHKPPVSKNALVVAWGERFLKLIEVSNHDRFMSLYECECVSLGDTLERLGLRVDPRPYVEELRAYWRAPEIHPEVMQTLADLNACVCCVSNADRADVLSASRRHGLEFEAIVTSEDARCYKPAPGIFEFALEVMGLSAGDVVHVGDSLHSDVEGACRLGIDTVWVCRDRRIHDIGTARPTHKISSLKELRLILAT